MKSINFFNVSVPQLVLSSYQNSLTPELISDAYSLGIRVFSTSFSENESEKTLGEWINNNAITDTIFLTRIDCRNLDNLEAAINYSLDRFKTTNVIIHISYPELDKVTGYIEILQKLVLEKKILGFGFKTYDIRELKTLVLKHPTTLMIPFNLKENALYLNTKALIEETTVKVVATDVFGGGLLLPQHPIEFILKGALALVGDSFIAISMRSKQEIEEVIRIMDAFDPTEIYPILKDTCDNCQLCTERCIHDYPLATAVRYARYIKEGDAELQAWGIEKLKEISIPFECGSCRRCIEACPLQLPVTTYIQEGIRAYS